MCRPLVVPRRLPSVGAVYRLTDRAPAPPAVRGTGGYDGRSFRFLNRRLICDGTLRWAPEASSHLWRYNLHYFQYLWGLEPRVALGLIEDWITENISLPSVGWEPYPLSLRIREWIEWLLSNRSIGPSAAERILASVAQQVQALLRQVEYHIMGNHLLENAITLCWAGLSLQGPDSKEWLSSGGAILKSELERQVLADGVHDERSPMYQALLAEALLRLAEVARQSAGVPGSEGVRAVAAEAGAKMLDSLRFLQHPDGEYALVNDAAFGIAPTRAQLVARFGAPCAAVAQRPGASGYLLARVDRHYLLFDAGPLGPNHQPGHGHADTLSFELSLHGRRVITDTGTYTYDPSPVRQFDRGTVSHNTVAVDGRDQSELWASFRCGRRTVTETAAYGSGGIAAPVLDGAYSGPRGIRHRRTLSLSKDCLTIHDQLQAKGSHEASSRLHFAPGLRLTGSGRQWTVHDGATPIARIESQDVDWVCSTSPYHPEFGLEVERHVLCAAVRFSDTFRSSATLRFL